MTEIRLIDAQHSKDINLPNEPFKLFGRLIPRLILFCASTESD